MSRGGRKLAGALEASARRPWPSRAGNALDAGASTGGFTDVLLRAGAAHVVAVDVGYGQLAWSLRTDPRVTVLDRVNVRTLEQVDAGARPGRRGSVVHLPDLGAAGPGGLRHRRTRTSCCMVKPQFEVGKGRVGAGGVVREAADRSAAVEKVAGAAAELGLGVRGITASPLPGPAGNVEYFLWLRRDAPPLDLGELQRAIEEGPT